MHGKYVFLPNALVRIPEAERTDFCRTVLKAIPSAAPWRVSTSFWTSCSQQPWWKPTREEVSLNPDPKYLAQELLPEMNLNDHEWPTPTQAPQRLVERRGPGHAGRAFVHPAGRPAPFGSDEYINTYATLPSHAPGDFGIINSYGGWLPCLVYYRTDSPSKVQRREERRLACRECNLRDSVAEDPREAMAVDGPKDLRVDQEAIAVLRTARQPIRLPEDRTASLHHQGGAGRRVAIVDSRQTVALGARSGFLGPSS